MSVTTQHQRTCPVNVDHNATDFIADPYPTYEAMRELDPVHHSDKYGGYYLLTRYADVRSGLLDWKNFSSGKPGVTSIPMSVERTFPEIPLEIDPPEHRPYRNVVTPWFSRRRVDTLEAEVRAITTDLLDGYVHGDRIDFVQDLAAPLVSRVLAVFLNVPESESTPWAKWMSDIFHGRLTDRELANSAGKKLIGYVDSKIAAAKEAPGDDFFGMLAQAEYAGRPLTDEEMRGYGVLTMTAGQETTVNGIGNSLWYLGTHPEERSRLASKPEGIASAVEEFLRFLSPIQLLGRTTTGDVEVSGTVIPGGSTVAMCYGSANRDESVFENADTYVPDRAYNPHIAFGAGPHACLGAHLARVEMKVVLEEVLRRIPGYDLRLDELQMTPHGDLRGPWRLPADLPGSA
jgi:cytochrome P450